MSGETRSSPGRALPLSTTVPLAIVFGVGLILFVGWLAVLVPTLAFVSTAKSAEGVYMGSEARTGGLHGGTFLHPQVRFETSDGRVVDVVAKSGSTDQPFTDGQRLRVLYDPAHPEQARLDTFFELWAGPVFLAPFALLPLLISAGLYVVARRRA